VLGLQIVNNLRSPDLIALRAEHLRHRAVPELR
jgi:hypothetical protein